jgi:hypothetical protein
MGRNRKAEPVRGRGSGRLNAEEEQTERGAIMNETAFPPPGSEARKIIDLNHERMVRACFWAWRGSPKGASYDRT